MSRSKARSRKIKMVTSKPAWDTQQELKKKKKKKKRKEKKRKKPVF